MLMAEAEPRARWLPKAEQLQILEQRFQQDPRNPNKDDMEHLRQQLLCYGHVSQTSLFYWFQNRRAREKANLRRRMPGMPIASPSPIAAAAVTAAPALPLAPPLPATAVTTAPALPLAPPLPATTVTATATAELQLHGHHDDSGYVPPPPPLPPQSPAPANPHSHFVNPNPNLPGTTGFAAPDASGIMKTVVIDGIMYKVIHEPLKLYEEIPQGKAICLVDLSNGDQIPINTFGFAVAPLRHGGSYITYIIT